jgi:hypothetical protein
MLRVRATCTSCVKQKFGRILEGQKRERRSAAAHSLARGRRPRSEAAASAHTRSFGLLTTPPHALGHCLTRPNAAACAPRPSQPLPITASAGKTNSRRGGDASLRGAPLPRPRASTGPTRRAPTRRAKRWRLWLRLLTRRPQPNASSAGSPARVLYSTRARPTTQVDSGDERDRQAHATTATATTTTKSNRRSPPRRATSAERGNAQLSRFGAGDESCRPVLGRSTPRRTHLRQRRVMGGAREDAAAQPTLEKSKSFFFDFRIRLNPSPAASRDPIEHCG